MITRRLFAKHSPWRGALGFAVTVALCTLAVLASIPT